VVPKPSVRPVEVWPELTTMVVIADTPRPLL
jgi:hypothetical protein